MSIVSTAYRALAIALSQDPAAVLAAKRMMILGKGEVKEFANDQLIGNISPWKTLHGKLSELIQKCSVPQSPLQKNIRLYQLAQVILNISKSNDSKPIDPSVAFASSP